MANSGSLTGWIAEKLGLGPRYIAVPYNPQPIMSVPPGSTTSLSAAEPATLVGSSSHTKGTSGDNRSSLISGR